ncbi:hypothetical protein RIR_jg36181.t1 [Rhizophagus irregularis DAOM 181602=DAOM 197198]|uniref:Uncharacterized protein n=1 Tax=Rhizophagus irregularis (strain DAOM 181602 / DAOM 197198 / MUCL 43194) TaxID=747089 RepID=U9TJZ3_RHIID|nr:hypothetical protein RIR_jg36181.t1 [Rhizophagus irregularis DAOM 181602=DAOM 197198]
MQKLDSKSSTKYIKPITKYNNRTKHNSKPCNNTTPSITSKGTKIQDDRVIGLMTLLVWLLECQVTK